MDQTQAESTESRLASFFGAPEAAPKAEATTEPIPEQVQETPEQQTEEDDGLDDLDLGDSVYRVPKDLKEKVSEWKAGYERQSDYTQKTQKLADITRQAQAMAEAVQLRQAFETEVQEDKGHLDRVKAELERYKQVDWSSLEVEQYIKLKGQYDSLKDQATELNEKLGKKAGEFTQKIEAQKKASVQEGLKYLQKAIPNFGAESVQQARSAATGIGYTDPELDNVFDARFVALSWKASQYDKLMSKKDEAVSTAQKAPPIVKPGVSQGQGTVRDQKYKDARAAMKKNPNDLQAAARVFLMRSK